MEVGNLTNTLTGCYHFRHRNLDARHAALAKIDQILGPRHLVNGLFAKLVERGRSRLGRDALDSRLLLPDFDQQEFRLA